MEKGHGPESGQIAEKWLRHDPSVCLSTLTALGFDFASIITKDPAKFVVFERQLVEEARKRGAPSEVISVLHGTVEKFEAGLARLPEHKYLQATLQRLHGKQKVDEIEAVINDALKDAPDKVSRQILGTISTVIKGRQQLPDGALSWNWGACGFCAALGFTSGFGLLGAVVGCIFCGLTA